MSETAYHRSFGRLLNIMNDLRENCPWDKKQTAESLRNQTIEELYELTEALDKKDWNGIKEELGDLLLHIVFYSRIAAEQQQFDIGDVLEAIANKLVFRHPHIYADTVVRDEAEVKSNWEQLKQKEGKKPLLSGIPDGLPALPKSHRIQEKVRQVGFEWETTAETADKVEEEWQELREAVEKGRVEDIEAEFGDLLFSLVNYARYLHVDPERALERTNRKFKSRFGEMEQLAVQSGRGLHQLSLKEMDALWEKAKQSNP